MGFFDGMETWWEKVLLSLVALVIWSPLIGILALSGISVAKDYPPMEAPFEFVVFTLAVAGMLLVLLMMAIGFVCWFVGLGKK